MKILVKTIRGGKEKRVCMSVFGWKSGDREEIKELKPQ